MSILKSSRLVLLGLLSIHLGIGCSEPSGNTLSLPPDVRAQCGEYSAALEDQESGAAVLAWADSHVFSRAYEPHEYRNRWYVGPGWRSYRLGEGWLAWPPGFARENVEIQHVGPYQRSPGVADAIFITRGRYKGLVIVRQDWSKVFDGVMLQESDVVSSVGRIGLICFTDR